MKWNVGKQTITRLRRTITGGDEGYDSDGLPIVPTDIAVSFKATVNPIPGDEILTLPEGERQHGQKRVLTEYPLRAVDEETGEPGDHIVYKGERWEVRDIQIYDLVIPHYAARIRRVDGVTAVNERAFGIASDGFNQIAEFGGREYYEVYLYTMPDGTPISDYTGVENFEYMSVYIYLDTTTEGETFDVEPTLNGTLPTSTSIIYLTPSADDTFPVAATQYVLTSGQIELITEPTSYPGDITFRFIDFEFQNYEYDESGPLPGTVTLSDLTFTVELVDGR